MSVNQFSAKIRFFAFAWAAFDKETGAQLTVVEQKEGATWRVHRHGPVPPFFDEGGKCSNAKTARAAARRAVKKYARQFRKQDKVSQGRKKNAHRSPRN